MAQIYLNVGPDGVVKRAVGNKTLKAAFDPDRGVVGWAAESAKDYVDVAQSRVCREAEKVFTQASGLAARHVLTRDINRLESLLYQIQTSSAGVDLGTTVAGVQVSGGVTLKFNPGTCFNLGKAISDLLKLIGIVKSILDLIGKLLPPGDQTLGKLKSRIKLLGKFTVPCVDLSVAGRATMSSFGNCPEAQAKEILPEL